MVWRNRATYVVFLVAFWRGDFIEENVFFYVVSCNFSLYGMGQNRAEEEPGEQER